MENNETSLALKIDNAFYGPNAEPGQGEQIWIVVTGEGHVHLDLPDSNSVILTLGELDAVYHFAIREAKRQGHQLE